MNTEKKHNRDRYHGGIRTVLMLILAAVFLFSLYKVVSILKEYKEINDFYDKTEELYTAKEENQLPEVDFEKLQKVNEDVIGWIYIEDTDISYPILKGADNNQYLFQSYEKKYVVAGSIFIDSRCSEDFGDERTVVYGHNMKNGSMFGTLDRYEKEEYRNAHENVYILLPDGRRLQYQAKKAYKADVDGSVYELPAERQGKDSSGGQKLFLSTCTEDSSNTQRFVVECELAAEIK